MSGRGAAVAVAIACILYAATLISLTESRLADSAVRDQFNDVRDLNVHRGVKSDSCPIDRELSIRLEYLERSPAVVGVTGIQVYEDAGAVVAFFAISALRTDPVPLGTSAPQLTDERGQFYARVTSDGIVTVRRIAESSTISLYGSIIFKHRGSLYLWRPESVGGEESSLHRLMHDRWSQLDAAESANCVKDAYPGYVKRNGQPRFPSDEEDLLAEGRNEGFCRIAHKGWGVFVADEVVSKKHSLRIEIQHDRMTVMSTEPAKWSNEIITFNEALRPGRPTPRQIESISSGQIDD